MIDWLFGGASDAQTVATDAQKHLPPIGSPPEDLPLWDNAPVNELIALPMGNNRVQFVHRADLPHLAAWRASEAKPTRREARRAERRLARRIARHVRKR